MGVGRCMGLAQHQALLVFWGWLLWEFEAVDKGADGFGASDHSCGSLGLDVSGHSGGCSSLLSLLGLWFIPQEYSLFLLCWGHSSFIICGFQQWSLQNLSLSSHIEGVLYLWRSCAALHRTLGGTSDVSAQCCRAWASTRVSSCLVTRKSLKLRGSTEGSKSQWHSLLMLLPWQRVAWKPWPATRQIVGHGHHWGCSLSSPHKEL